MPDFPLSLKLKNRINISSFSPESVGREIGAMVGGLTSSSAWGTANLAVYIPFEVYNPLSIVNGAFTVGTVVAGNVDLGIYNSFGDLLTSAGSTLVTGASTINILNFTDVTLNPALYYMAIAFDTTTVTLTTFTSLSNPELRSIGVFQQTTAFPLPATAVFALNTQTQIPFVTLSQPGII